MNRLHVAVFVLVACSSRPPVVAPPPAVASPPPAEPVVVVLEPPPAMCAEPVIPPVPVEPVDDTAALTVRATKTGVHSRRVVPPPGE